VDALLAALQDPHHWVRAVAAESLGRLGDRRAIHPLLERLKDAQEDRDVRARAAESLGQLEAADAVAPLIAVLNHTVWYVRYQSVIALGRIGDPAAVPALEHTARYDPDHSVRDAARQVLQRIAPADAEDRNSSTTTLQETS
jgi:HEAT repeat protein